MPADRSITPPPAPELSGAPRGLERWLKSPFRAALLALAAVSGATAGTVLGEVELRSAGGIGAVESEVVLRQFGLWCAWALLTPLIVGASIWLGRRHLAWPLVVLVHVPMAAVLAGGFLVAEIRMQEFAQGPEKTARFAEILEWQESMREMRRQAIAEGRDPWAQFRGGRRGGDRDRRDGATARGEPGPEDATASEGGRSERPAGERTPPREPRSNDRRRDWRRGRAPAPAVNVATGDLIADFERRWPLRVPRYMLVYFTLLGIGLGVRSYLVGRTKEREAQALAIRAGQLESDLNRARLESLKGQLHPHFLFNALHSVGGLVRTDRSREAVTALGTIGDLLRTSLDSGPEQFVTLGREIELVQRYLAVESLRLGDRLDVSIEVPAALREVEVPAFIAQPLVENAIKHGVAARPQGGKVTIRAFAQDEATLILDVEDDGPGLPDGWTPPPGGPADHGGGVGLSHVRGRLDALFAGAGALEISNLPSGGMRARLRLPLEDLDPPMA